MMAGAPLPGAAGGRVAVGAARAGAGVGRGAEAGSGVRSGFTAGTGVAGTDPPPGFAAGAGVVLRWVLVERVGPAGGVGEPLASSGGWNATGEPLPAMIASIVRSGVG